MSKNAFYRERILWKARQHNLLEKRCILFSELSNENSELIRKTINEEIDPVLVFWDSAIKWTILCSDAIYSFYDNNLVSSLLNDIDKKTGIGKSPNAALGDSKLTSDLIILEKENKKIWAPEGKELFALMNILKMFPLN